MRKPQEKCSKYKLIESVDDNLPPAISPHQRHGDRSSDDDDGVIWRFRDLKRRQIVGNWTTLLEWIAAQDFPPGFRLGPNSRAWFATDVIAWLKSRPAAGVKQQHDHAEQ